MTTFDAKRALELADWCVAGPAVVLPYLPEVADMLRAAVAEVEASKKVQVALRRELDGNFEEYVRARANEPRLAADLNNAKYANEHAVLALKEALAEVDELNRMVGALQEERDEGWSEAIRGANELRLFSKRLEAAENVCRSLEAWEGKPNSSLIRRWQYIRDAKEGT